jgi:hypothetical protein
LKVSTFQKLKEKKRINDKKDRGKKILPEKEDYLSFLEMFWSP